MSDLYLRDLMPIVELQALELKRLMRDKEHLNQRIECLIGEIGSLRQLQQQDQSLREREQELRAKMQQALSDLVSHSAGFASVSEQQKTVSVAELTPAKNVDPVQKDTGKLGDASDLAEAPWPTAAPADVQRMEIPSFLANGPRIGFDQQTAEDIRDIHGPSPEEAEAPIKKLLARIRERNAGR